MKNFLAGIADRVVGPAIRRVGSVLAGMLATYGMTAEGAAQVEVAATALGLFALDLVMSNLGLFKGGKR